MLSVLSHKETKLIKTNRDISETEIGGSLSVRVKGGFWVNIDWDTLLLSLSERQFIKTNRNIDETEFSSGLSVSI